MGFAELFIDPVAMAQITRLNIPGATGVLTGIYMLATGSIANYRRALSLIRPPRITSRGGDAGVWPHFRSDRLGSGRMLAGGDRGAGRLVVADAAPGRTVNA